MGGTAQRIKVLDTKIREYERSSGEKKPGLIKLSALRDKICPKDRRHHLIKSGQLIIDYDDMKEIIVAYATATEEGVDAVAALGPGGKGPKAKKKGKDGGKG